MLTNIIAANNLTLFDVAPPIFVLLFSLPLLLIAIAAVVALIIVTIVLIRRAISKNAAANKDENVNKEQ